MASTVQVLCPNGRRQNVKVTPNTKLMQVLEEVCTKQALLPPDNYTLIHGRTTLDLTLAIRFSNLPNNAKLELTKSTIPRSQAQGEVTIALQLENGERLHHTFQPSTSLWQILEHWESQNESCRGKLTFTDASQSPPLHPVCIYMREEVIGESALKDMTLKKLALASGKAVIRLVHRPVDDSTLAEIIGKLEQEEAKQARLAQKAQQAEQSEAAMLSASKESQHSSSVDGAAVTSDTKAHMQEKISEEKMDVQEEPVEKMGEKTAQEACRKEMSTLQTEPMDTQDVTGQASQFSESRESGASSASARLSNVDSAQSGAVGVSAIERLRQMNIPGVEIITPNDFYDLSPEQQQMARLLAERLMPGVAGMFANQQPVGPKPKRAKPVPKRQPFAEFKFPEETKGKDLYRNEMSEVKPEDYKPCERDTVVYDSNEENTSKAIDQELPDDFFEVTDSDVKSLYKDLQKQASEERLLTTKAMRQAELEERHRQYDHVVMRIQFPDGLVLQGCFRPRETVYSLHKFVKDHLEDKGQDFYLYKTPPKQTLSDMAQTLVEADLAPASLVYFGSNTKEDHSLVASARTEIVPKRRADELSVKKLAKKQMESLASGCSSVVTLDTSTTLSVNTVEPAEKAPDRPRDPATRGAAAVSGEPKMPKWLKLGKK